MEIYFGAGVGRGETTFTVGEWAGIAAESTARCWPWAEEPVSGPCGDGRDVACTGSDTAADRDASRGRGACWSKLSGRRRRRSVCEVRDEADSRMNSARSGTCQISRRRSRMGSEESVVLFRARAARARGGWRWWGMTTCRATACERRSVRGIAVGSRSWHWAKRRKVRCCVPTTLTSMGDECAEGLDSLLVTITGEGDADLYVRFGSRVCPDDLNQSWDGPDLFAPYAVGSRGVGECTGDRRRERCSFGWRRSSAQVERTR